MNKTEKIVQIITRTTEKKYITQFQKCTATE